LCATKSAEQPTENDLTVMNTKSKTRHFLTLATLIGALTLGTAAQVSAAPAPGPVRALDSNSDRLLSSARSDAKNYDGRGRDRLKAAAEDAQEFENAVDRLRSAVENRSNYRAVQAALAAANEEFRDVERALDTRGVSKATRFELQKSREALWSANRALSSGWSGRGDRDGRGRDDRYDRDDRHDDRGPRGINIRFN
jgi:hypothetical protein